MVMMMIMMMSDDDGDDDDDDGDVDGNYEFWIIINRPWPGLDMALKNNCLPLKTVFSDKQLKLLWLFLYDFSFLLRTKKSFINGIQIIL